MSYEDIKKYVEQNNIEGKDPATSDVNGENPNKQGTGDQERLKGESRKPVSDINKNKKPGINSKQLEDIIGGKEENGDYGDRDPNSLLREYLGQLGDE